MKEDFIYFLWKFQLFDHTDLKTQCGKSVQIKKVGYQNNNSGPDFSEAHLVIDGMEWFGNVEMHTNSSDWFEHKHQYDKAYNSVILHIVWNYNIPITDTMGREIPTIELAPLTDDKYLTNYETLNLSLGTIPCGERLIKVPQIYFKSELENQLVHRLERKVEKWKSSKTGELKTVFYELLAQSFGFKVNSEAFLQTAQQIPLTTLLKQQNDQSEALLFGVSGLLTELWEDDYPKKLLKEWKYLQHKFQLPEVAYVQWKFSKMRPPNFPTIRMAQFARLINDFQPLFDAVNTNKSLVIIKKFFQNDVSTYWKAHYTFDKKSKEKSKIMGKSSFYLVVINAIIPFIYLKYLNEKEENVFDYLIDLLEELPAESNHKIDQFTALGIKPKTALETQALMELLDNKCTSKQCLSCQIGNHLVRKQKNK